MTPSSAAADPAPLSPRQLRALGGAATRELLWGQRTVSKEIRRWREHAQRIPDETIRADALHVLERKRTHIHGAALFWTIPRNRNRDLLRLLVAYELIWDLLDNLSERAARYGQTNGRQLHLAIAEAIDPRIPISDYYLQHPWDEDGGYLSALVETCRQGCASLPSYPLVRELALGEAHRAQVLALNHYPDPSQRDYALEQWTAREHPGERRASWWELTAAASAPLTIYALLALAAEPHCSHSEIARTYDAYCPWISAATTMLDSYVDQAEDITNGDHRYITHYPDPASAVRGIQALVRTSVVEARALPGGHKHSVIAAAMIAMYLSKDTARTPRLRVGTASFIRAGGSLTQLLLPILRAWRTTHAQRSA
jgi:tetraprenyl-beta-curcumene synthase